MCNVLIYDIPFGIRVFMHRDFFGLEANWERVKLRQVRLYTKLLKMLSGKLILYNIRY